MQPRCKQGADAPQAGNDRNAQSHRGRRKASWPKPEMRSQCRSQTSVQRRSVAMRRVQTAAEAGERRCRCTACALSVPFVGPRWGEPASSREKLVARTRFIPST